MTAEKETSRESRLCSVVSKAAGDDPGGTASTFDAYLGIELVPPWMNPWKEGSVVHPLRVAPSYYPRPRLL